MFTTIHAITGAWTTAVELVPLLMVPAAIWGLRTTLELLDRLAAAAQLTYAAGRACGRLWYAHGLPALLRTADGISWLLAQVDWVEALATAAAAGRAALALLLTTAITLHRLLLAASAALGHRYAALLTSAPAAAPAATPAPAARSLNAAVLLSLDGMSQRQIAQALGISRRQVRAALALEGLAAAA